MCSSDKRKKGKNPRHFTLQVQRKGSISGRGCYFRSITTVPLIHWSDTSIYLSKTCNNGRGKKAFRNICVPCSCLIGVLGDWAQKAFSVSVCVPVPALLCWPRSCCVEHKAPAQLQKTLGPSAVDCCHWQQEGRWTLKSTDVHKAVYNCREKCHLVLTAVKHLSTVRARIPSTCKLCSTQAC